MPLRNYAITKFINFHYYYNRKLNLLNLALNNFAYLPNYRILVFIVTISLYCPLYLNE